MVELLLRLLEVQKDSIHTPPQLVGEALSGGLQEKILIPEITPLTSRPHFKAFLPDDLVRQRMGKHPLHKGETQLEENFEEALEKANGEKALRNTGISSLGPLL